MMRDTNEPTATLIPGDVLLERCGTRQVIARWSPLAAGWKWIRYIDGTIDAFSRNPQDTPDNAYRCYVAWKQR